MKISLVGFGISNKSIIKNLDCMNGYEFFVSDKNGFSKKDLQLLSKRCVGYEENHSERILDADVLIVSPGISPMSSVGKMILQSDVYRDIDVSFFFKIFPKRSDVCTIAVTGTNGKTTTVSLIEYVLNSLGKKVISAGNNERPIFELSNKHFEFIVLELSSFQLFWAKYIPVDLGIILNIYTDHLDWHGSFEDYKSAKLRLRDFSRTLLIGEELYDLKKFNYVGVFRRDDVEIEKVPVKLRTIQNIQNIAAAKVALVNELKLLSSKDFYDILKDFQLPRHRMEYVGEINGVKFFNDSKATNTHAVLSALKNFQKVTLILSGIFKETELEDFAETVKEKTDYIILLGESAKKTFKALIKDAYYACDMEDAVKKAMELSKSGIVLFSPGGASFDLYKNYKERGEKFIDAFKKLKSMV